MVEHPPVGGEEVARLEGKERTSRCSSVVEHFLGKEEVAGSIPINGSNLPRGEVFK